jgi:hypothetical protein
MIAPHSWPHSRLVPECPKETASSGALPSHSDHPFSGLFFLLI